MEEANVEAAPVGHEADETFEDAENCTLPAGLGGRLQTRGTHTSILRFGRLIDFTLW